MFVDLCILLLKHLSNRMHFVTNGYERFSKTNSTDPRQGVPLKTHILATLQEVLMLMFGVINVWSNYQRYTLSLTKRAGYVFTTLSTSR